MTKGKKKKKSTTEIKLNKNQNQNVPFYSKQDIMEKVPDALEASLGSVTLIFRHGLSNHDVVHKISKD